MPVFQPNFASFSNIFGRKPLVLVSLTLFFVGTIIAGLANNFTNMLAGRSIQGIGGGGLIALTEIIITDLIPLRERGTYFGIISAMWSVGSVTGPILGGGFSQSVSWVSRMNPCQNFPQSSHDEGSTFLSFFLYFFLSFLLSHVLRDDMLTAFCQFWGCRGGFST